MKRQKSKMGRPPLPAGQARSVRVFFRTEPALYEKLAATAKREGKPVATWIHDTLAQLLKGE